MAHDQPDLPEILRTVREFIDDLVPRLGGLERYHALCALHLLDIALRELVAEWRHTETDDDRRLRALLGTDAALSSAEVRARLAHDIRDGRFDAELPALLAPLLAHVVAKVRIAKPDVLVPEHATGAAPHD